MLCFIIVVRLLLISFIQELNQQTKKSPFILSLHQQFCEVKGPKSLSEFQWMRVSLNLVPHCYCNNALSEFDHVLSSVSQDLKSENGGGIEVSSVLRNGIGNKFHIEPKMWPWKG